MKRAMFLATASLLAMLILAPMAMGQGPGCGPGSGCGHDDLGLTSSASASPTPVPLGGTGGPAILLPAAALLLWSGILTYAILRRR